MLADGTTKVIGGETSTGSLRWLIDHGKCSETNAQPLVELFKDIRREDLAGRVEDFQKEFGKDMRNRLATLILYPPR